MTQEEQDKRIDYVEFPATDIARIQSFYSAVFGWVFSDWGPDYTSFSDSGLRGGFQRMEAVESGGPLVVIYALDLAEAEAKITEHGGTIVKEVFEFPGGRRFHFADPSGNVLAVWSDK